MAIWLRYVGGTKEKMKSYQSAYKKAGIKSKIVKGGYTPLHGKKVVEYGLVMTGRYKPLKGKHQRAVERHIHDVGLDRW